MKLTAKRLAWLQLLTRRPHSRTKGTTGYRCMIQGWTEWNYCERDSAQPISYEEAKKKYGDGLDGRPDWYDHVYMNGERLTDRGRWLAAFGVVGEDYE